MPARSGGGRTSVAGASARARYRVLWREHRAERLITCAVVAAVSGTGTAAVSGWRVAAVAAAAAGALYLFYAWIRPGPVTRWRRGAAAERRTGRYLSRLDPAGYHVLHDRALPDRAPPDRAPPDRAPPDRAPPDAHAPRATGRDRAAGAANSGSAASAANSGSAASAARPGRGGPPGDPARGARHGPVANLDHLVIGLTGVYAIVTRRWRPGTGIWLEGRRLLIGGRSAARLLRTTDRTAAALSAVLGAELDFDVPVSGVVATYGARVPRTGLVYEQVVFQRADRLTAFIRDHPVVFTSAQVAAVAAVAERHLPRMNDRPEE